MKKILISCVLILFVIAVCVLGIFIIDNNSNKVEQDGVTITPKLETLTPTSITVLIKSEKNEYKIDWKYWDKLQKKSFNKWEDLPEIEPRTIMMGISFSLDDKNESEYTLKWSDRYGKLEKGTYRAVLYCDTKNGETEFYSTPFKVGENVDTPKALALPNTIDKTPDEVQQEEKEKFALEHSDLQNEIVEDKAITPLSMEENVDESFVIVLKKYYGDDEIEDTYTRIFREIENRDDDTKLTNSQIEILEKTLELISSTRTTVDEKEILKEALKDEIPYITDEEILNKINNVLE